MIRKSTWIFVLVFLALLAGVYLWQRKEMQTEAEATPTPGAQQEYLFNIEGAISDVRIERVGDKALEMQKDDQGNWKIISPEGLETDNDAANNALASLPAMPVVTTLAQVPDLEAMGLAHPAYRIVVKTSAEKSYDASVGGATPTKSGYYVMSSNRSIMIVSTYTLDALLNLVDTPPVLQSTPTPEESVRPLLTPDLSGTPTP